MSLNKTEMVPQGGNVAEAGKNSSTVEETVCPTVSGGGKNSLDTGIVRNPTSSSTTNHEVSGNNTSQKARNPFDRLDLIARSPTRARAGSLGSTKDIFPPGGSLNTSIMGHPTPYTLCGQSESSIKRKRVEESSQVICDGKTLMELKTKITELKGLIPANTKAEIKKGIEHIRFLLQNIELDDIENTRKRDKSTNMHLRDISTQTEAIDQPIPQTVVSEQGTQTDITSSGEDNNTLVEEKALREHIWESLAKEQTFENFQEINSIDWPKSAYRKVKIETGNPERNSPEWDLAFYMSDNTEKDVGLGKVLKDKYPDLVDAEPPADGYVTGLSTASTLAIPGKPIKTETKHIYKLTPRILNDKTENLKSLYDCLTNLKERVLQANRGKIAIVFQNYVDFESAKRATEYVFVNTDIDTAVYVKKEKPTTNYRSKQQAPKTSGKEALVIKAEGRTYADLLRTVKSKVDPGKVGVTVREIRKTKKGDMLLTIDSSGTPNKLKDEILNGIQGSSVNVIGRKDKLINIIDLDAVTTADEIIEQMVDQFQVRKEDLLIKNLRPTSIGKQIATVSVNSEQAVKILNAGKVKIGWLNCRIRERVLVQKCYRCLSFGHVARNCQGPNRANTCYKCCQEGHKAAACMNIEYCHICKQNGHNAGSLKCPEYKKLLMSATKQKSSINKQNKNGSKS